MPLLIGTTRDEMAFFTLGEPGAERRSTTTACAAGCAGSPRTARPRTASSPRCTEARLARGEPVTPRDLWVAIATEYVFRVPSVRLADAHRASAGPGVGTYVYLFTWESPMLDGYLGSCHALEIPFVFGTVRNPAVQGFAGGGPRPSPCPAAMPGAWTSFARTGVPGGPGRPGTPDRPARPGSWAVARRPGVGAPGRRAPARGAGRRGRGGAAHPGRPDRSGHGAPGRCRPGGASGVGVRGAPAGGARAGWTA